MMASRYLEVGDHVKVKLRTSKNFGRFGIVEDVNGYAVIVAIYENAYNRVIVDRFAMRMSHLLLANLPEERVDYNNSFPNSVVDTEEECEYADWTHDDLVERIKQLERVIEQHEEPFLNKACKH